MPLIHPLLPQDAPPPVRAVYADFADQMRFPAAPNFILTQGHSETVAEATWDLVRGVLVTGLLPRWVKEMMFTAISRDRNCLYCEAAHLACCRMLGVDDGTLAALRRDIAEISDRKAAALVTFAIKCSRNPSTLVQADYDALVAHGLREAEIIEAIAVSGLAVYANIMADATQVQPDALFAAVMAGPPSAAVAAW